MVGFSGKIPPYSELEKIYGLGNVGPNRLCDLWMHYLNINDGEMVKPKSRGCKSILKLYSIMIPIVTHPKFENGEII